QTHRSILDKERLRSAASDPRPILEWRTRLPVDGIRRLIQVNESGMRPLFDATNSDIAESAPLVFSEVYGEPSPSGKSASEEKAFWTGKISTHLE
ncbi:MAG: hypothetical protein V2A34_02940, partial [Lentisphaerota bacterium]